MNTWILAAGRGSRLNSLTDDKPKCLVNFMGRSLLSWQIEALRSGNAGNIGIIVGYSKDSIPSTDLQVIENPRWAETNMVYSLCCAEPEFDDEPFLVSYSDILYPAKTVKKLIGCEEDIVIAFDLNWESLWKTRMDNPLEDAESFRFGADYRIQEIGNQAQDINDIMGQYMGLLRFTAKGWRITKSILDTLTRTEIDSLQMTQLLARIIEAGHQVTGVPILGHWLEVDTQQDIDRYEKVLSKHDIGAWHHDWRLD